MFFVEKWVQKNNIPLLFSGLRSSRGFIKKGIQFRNSIPGRERILTPGMGRWVQSGDWIRFRRVRTMTGCKAQ